MADGNEYGIVLLKEAGQPVEPIVSERRIADDLCPDCDLRRRARTPNAARLFQAWLHTRETQQFFTRLHRAIFGACGGYVPKPGRRKLSDLKLMKEDPAGVEAMAEEIKTRYAKLFRGLKCECRRARVTLLLSFRDAPAAAQAPE